MARKFTDYPVCPRCMRAKGDDGIHYWVHPSPNGRGELLLLHCNRCGYEWWMDVAYTNWKEFDDDFKE